MMFSQVHESLHISMNCTYRKWRNLNLKINNKKKKFPIHIILKLHYSINSANPYRYIYYDN